MKCHPEAKPKDLACDSIAMTVSYKTEYAIRFCHCEGAKRLDSVKRVIPVRIHQNAEIPFFLRDRAYCDLSTELDYSRNMEQLISILRKPVERIDQRRIEKAGLYAFGAEKTFLQKEIDAQSRKRYVRMGTVSGALASAVGGSLTVLFGLTKIFPWLFVWGFLPGVLGLLLCTSAPLRDT